MLNQFIGIISQNPYLLASNNIQNVCRQKIKLSIGTFAYNNLLEIYAPYDINQYFFLDPETYKESYTFFPKTKDELKFNQLTMRVRE